MCIRDSLDDIDVKQIRKWEQDFLSYLDSVHPDILNGIRTKKALDDELNNKLKAAISTFKLMFVPE